MHLRNFGRRGHGAESESTTVWPNSGLTWIRQRHVEHVLRELACHPTLTHELIDQLPAGRTTNYVRGLLVAH